MRLAVGSGEERTGSQLDLLHEELLLHHADKYLDLLRIKNDSLGFGSELIQVSLMLCVKKIHK